MKKSRKEKKGTFSDLGLPVAKKYLVPVSRRPLILVGALAIAVAALYVAGDYYLRDAADLLQASAEVPPEALPALYEEAIATLEAYAVGLRARPEPEVRHELERIGSLLDELKRRLRDPLTPLDETKFLLALEGRRAGLDAGEAAAIEALAGDLTEVCRRCHLVTDLTIARVQKDQRVLRRAEFDHRAHILDRRCLDCHTAIPILDHLDQQADLPPAYVDNAAIQDLPAIDACRECHRPGLASNRCVTCHFFHPNKSRRSEMLLYLDVSTAAADGDGG